jgi:hypothetical protein
MTKDEALKLALEALEGVLDNSPKVLEASISGGLYEVVQCRDAITAIKEALAQTQEPVAYLCENAAGHKYFRWKKPSSVYKPIALYTTPPQRIEERNFCPRCGKRAADPTTIHTCTPPT